MKYVRLEKFKIAASHYLRQLIPTTLQRWTLAAIIACFVVIFQGIGVSSANGQDSPMTVDECVNAAISNSSKLHTSRMKVSQARAKAGEALTQLLPTATVGAFYTRLSKVPPFEVDLPPYPGLPGSFTLSESVQESRGLTLNIRQPLFTGLRLLSNLRMTRKNAAASSFDFESDSLTLVADVQTAYWNLFKAVEIKKAVDENLVQVSAHLEDARRFMDQNLLALNDVLKIETQKSQIQLMQIEADNAVRMARINLNNQIGIPLNSRTAIASSLSDELASAPPLDSLIVIGLSGRAEIDAINLRVEAGKAGVAAARAGWFPQVVLTGNYYRLRPNSRILPTRDEWDNTWDIGLALSFEAWNWGKTIHQTRQAQAQLEQAIDALDQLRDAVELEVTARYLDLTKAQQSIEVARNAVAQASENLRITKEKFHVDLASNTDLLDAEVALLQASTSYTTARVSQELAGIALKRALGR